MSTVDPRTTAGRRKRRWRWPLLLVFLLFACAAYLAGGFLRFAEDVASLSRAPDLRGADGIVVLTGGESRLQQALDLLKNGKGRRLLITGVNHDTGVGAIARLTGTDRGLFECCIDLDYEALNTIGNAEITVRWARQHDFARLILVTSDYHIPRSLLELAAVPGAPQVVPFPVSPQKLWQPSGLPTRLGLRILATEYAKVLAVKARQTLGIDIAAILGRRLAAPTLGAQSASNRT